MAEIEVAQKITIDLNGQKIELTKELAEKLHRALGDLLGVKERTTIPAPVPAPNPKRESSPWRNDWPLPWAEPYKRRGVEPWHERPRIWM